MSKRRDFNELIGKKYGRLKVRERTYSSTRAKFICDCECGNEKVIRYDHLESGKIKSCGCIRREVSANNNYVDLTGMKFNRLNVIKKAVVKKCGVYWHCLCDCGNETVLPTSHLKLGIVKSCGCYHKDIVRKPDSAIKRAYNGYKRNAINRGFSFDIDIEYFKKISQKDCHYCGGKANNRSITAGGIFIYNGMDRKDNSKGYNIKNVVACCRICNRAKNNIGYDEYIEWLKSVKEYWCN